VLKAGWEQALIKAWVPEGQKDPTHADVGKAVCQAWGSLERGSSGTRHLAPKRGLQWGRWVPQATTTPDALAVPSLGACCGG